MLLSRVPFNMTRFLRLAGDGAANLTLSGALTLAGRHEHVLRIDGGASSRDVNLDAVSAGRWYILRNVGATNNLVIKSGSTLATLRPGDVGLFVCGLSAWYSVATLRANAADLVYQSGVITATGSAQNTAHGLGVVPSLCVAIPVRGHNGAGSAGVNAPEITAGTHTSTNAVFTAEAGSQYIVIALK